MHLFKKVHFRLQVLAAMAALLVAVPVSSAFTQDTLIIEEDEAAVISGFVDEVYFDTFTLQHDNDIEGPPLMVRLEAFDLETYNSLDTLLSEGMRVRVHGELVDANTIQATRIVSLEPGW